MGKFMISPHMRLQEWVAEEKGYFIDEDLDYEFRSVNRGADSIKSAEEVPPDKRSGAYQTFAGGGRSCDVSSACHWTVNMAAAAGNGRLWGEAYSVTPSGIYVPPDSEIQRPEDLANVSITVGYQSGSHYSTIQALEPFLKPSEIKLDFGGMLFQRLELLVDREVPAANAFGGPLYLVEQLGFRKVLDTTFMVAAMVSRNSDPEDVRKCYRALKRAQADIDLRPERYTHYYRKQFPGRFHDVMDTRRFGPGERIVFEPYTQDMYEKTQEWVRLWEIFTEEHAIGAGYKEAVVQSYE
jgi:ABC-type nitrate/sulfonate/bicarbonate transport system substrate-binding protein